MWSSRLNGVCLEGAYITVDGTDCQIFEPSPFDSKWFSYKTNSAGLRYEIGLSISSGNIVWVNGPFPCGSNTDLMIFRSRLKSSLLSNEKCIADRGYSDEKCITPNNEISAISEITATLRARHETVNRRIKQFRAIAEKFRHDICLHGMVFFAVANITELLLETANPLFTISAA